MKEKFLTLVEEIKLTEAVETFCNTASAEELEEAWQDFHNENRELITQITNWAEEFRQSEVGPIFSWRDPIEDPMEIALILRIINNTNVSEYVVFENCGNFLEAVKAVGSHFADVIAEYIDTTYLCFVTAEDFF